jgi:hypothetical protein
MTTVNNSIDIDKRFISHNQREYNVFSRTLRNPTNIEKWVGLSQPHLVVMDPESYWSLRGEHLEWKFDDENRLTSVYVHASKKVESKAHVEEIEEIEEEFPAVVEERPAIGKRETPTFESMEEDCVQKEDGVREVSNTMNELVL